MFEAFLEKMSGHMAKQLPFVLYRKPNETDVQAILQHNDEVYLVADYTESGFVFAPFNGERPTILLPPDEKIKIAQPLELPKVLVAQTMQYDQNLDREAHIALVNKGLTAVESGVVDKLVLSRRLIVPNMADPLQLFKTLINQYASAFCYLWFHPKIGMWMGATPEILLKLHNNQFTTMSLAGTKTMEIRERPDWGKKELEEQALVTEYIKRALADKVINLKTFDLESILAGNLWHLRTKITGRLDNNLKEVLLALHPTPAVCGLPLSKAKKFILKNETYDRSYYTGYLGELNMLQEKNRSPNGKNIENRSYRTVRPMTEFYVNLRCMQLTLNEAIIYIGGGITKDSDPEKEWEETVNKSLTMIKVLFET